MATSKKHNNPLQDLLGMVAHFVTEQKGKWEHTDWESFLGRVQRAGVDLTDDMRHSLGGVLESSKKFYNTVTSNPPKHKAKAKSAKAKSKTKAKAKSAAKSKAKSKSSS